MLCSRQCSCRHHQIRQQSYNKLKRQIPKKEAQLKCQQRNVEPSKMFYYKGLIPSSFIQNPNQSYVVNYAAHEWPIAANFFQTKNEMNFHFFTCVCLVTHYRSKEVATASCLEILDSFRWLQVATTVAIMASANIIFENS